MCNRSHQMHQFSFSSLKLQSRSTHWFCHFIKCTIQYVYFFIIIDTNITRHCYKCHHFQSSPVSAIDIIHVAARYRLIRATLFWSWHPLSLSLKSNECSVSLYYHHNRNVFFDCTQYQHCRYIQTNTSISSLFTCVHGVAAGTLTSFPEVGWRKYDVRVTLQQCNVDCP